MAEIIVEMAGRPDLHPHLLEEDIKAWLEDNDDARESALAAFHNRPSVISPTNGAAASALNQSAAPASSLSHASSPRAAAPLPASRPLQQMGMPSGAAVTGSGGEASNAASNAAVYSSSNERGSSLASDAAASTDFVSVAAPPMPAAALASQDDTVSMLRTLREAVQACKLYMDNALRLRQQGLLPQTPTPGEEAVMKLSLLDDRRLQFLSAFSIRAFHTLYEQARPELRAWANQKTAEPLLHTAQAASSSAASALYDASVLADDAAAESRTTQGSAATDQQRSDPQSTSSSSSSASSSSSVAYGAAADHAPGFRRALKTSRMSPSSSSSSSALAASSSADAYASEIKAEEDESVAVLSFAGAPLADGKEGVGSCYISSGSGATKSAAAADGAGKDSGDRTPKAVVHYGLLTGGIKIPIERLLCPASPVSSLSSVSSADASAPAASSALGSTVSSATAETAAAAGAGSTGGAPSVSAACEFEWDESGVEPLRPEIIAAAVPSAVVHVASDGLIG